MSKNSDKAILFKLGVAIKKKREETNLSLRELSRLCNIDHSDIAKIEKGEKNITFITLVQLASALRITVKDLVDFI